jgi:hypothetical protein
MEFKIKYGSNFVLNIFFMFIAIVFAYITYHSFKTGLMDYAYKGWLFIALLRFYAYYRPLYLSIVNKPALIANREYIFDLTKNMKYYWKDIDTVYEKHTYLFIKLYKPKDYLNKINNPVKKVITWVIIQLLPKKSPFFIDTDIVDIHPSALLDILDDYSIEATANETP